MKIHLVPNSHIDPVWLWDKYEGIDEVLSTFRSACDRLDEFPELTFSASSIQFYKWVEKFDYGLFERIRKFVKKGRWEISGGWWIEPDTNLPTEESFRKHAEISREFLLKKFKCETRVAFLPDTFGHPAALPKILAETGFRYLIFCRPSISEKDDIPNLFHWEYNGHKILTYRLKHHYMPKPDTEFINDEEYKKNPVNCYFFGIGNHGGGPSIKEILFYNKFMKDNPNADIGYSTCKLFFEDVEKNTKDIPSYSGDLHMHAVGCYSVMRNLKNNIRTSELLLKKTERIIGKNEKNRRKLNSLWKKALFNQFHDILPGSCSPSAEKQAINEAGHVLNSCSDMIYDSLKKKSMSRKVKVKEGELRIYNSLPYDVKKPVCTEFTIFTHLKTALLDENNKIIESQKVLPDVRTDFTKRFEFIDTFPAESFKSYHFKLEGKEGKNITDTYFKSGVEIENKRFIIKSNSKIIGNNNAEILSSPLSFVVLEDNSDTWGHRVKSYDRAIGHFSPEFSSVLQGKVTSKLFERYSYNKSSLDIVYSIYNELPGIYIDIRVNWAEHRNILKMEIPLPDVTGSTFKMQGAGGDIERKASGCELPLHNWIWIPQNKAGFALIQNGAFACDFKDSRLRINLVRSSLYAFHDPFSINNLNPQHDTDQGIHEFKFLLLTNYKFDAEGLNGQTEIFLEDFVVINDGFNKK